jgi:pimeloyl-ACP methyl ester carboxylesterase
VDQTSLPVPTPDGRLLAAASFGPHDGRPVLACHGTPGSRLFTVPDLSLLDRAGIHLVTYDRPGYGSSTRRPGRTVADAAADIALVADALTLQRFGVLGFSGGGPHALASAALLGDRVTRCAAVSSVAPMDAPDLDFFAGMSAGNLEEFDAALAGEAGLSAALDPVASAVAEDVFAFMASLRADLPEPDRRALDQPAIDKLLATSMAEGLRPGAGGWVDDDLAFCRPWGFDAGRIRVPTGVWHGTEDTLVPAAHAAWMTAAVPRSEGHLLVGAGHLGALSEMEPILRWLTA